MLWAPRSPQYKVEVIFQQHNYYVAAFTAMWSAVMVGVAEQGLLGFLAVNLVGALLGYLVTLVLPWTSLAISYRLCLIGTLALVILVLV